MFHTEEPEQSAELLRQVIPRLSEHGSVYYPALYAVWYEYLAGTHGPLKAAIDERLAQSHRLTVAEGKHLYARYLAGRDAALVQRLQEGLQALLEQFGAVARAAGMEAAVFERQLSDTARRLSERLDTPVDRIVSELTLHARMLQGAASRLRERVEDGTAEIATLKQQLGQVESESLRDPMTDLLNRRGFEQALIAACTQRSNGLLGCTLLIADIDHFKRINDTYGHLFGDQVIRGIARVLHETIRGGDIAARLGGEEFAIMLPDTAYEDARAVAENIRTAVARCRVKRGGTDQVLEGVTVSLGLASALSGDTLEALFERADKALYQAKQDGRNRIEG
jgi:diguanylate cyclase